MSRRLPAAGPAALRWLLTALVAAGLIVVPLAVATRPAGPSELSAAQLLQRIQGSWRHGWSGSAASAGTLKLPDSTGFAALGTLLGQDNVLRAWWRSPTDWRVDRIDDTGESDLIRHHDTQLRWTFGSQSAVFSPTSRVRLPDASDLMPPTLGRRLLAGARPDEISRLPTRRIAGLPAVGLRLVPDDPASSVGRVDVWAEPDSGLTLQVEVSGREATRPVLTSAMIRFDPTRPPARTTGFVPAIGMKTSVDQSVDVAAAANAFAPGDLPVTLAGLSSRDGTDPGAVGSYGRGPTALLVLPLRGSVARALRQRLADGPTARRTSAGTLVSLGPVSALLTPRRPPTGRAAGSGKGSVSYLLTGTVTPAVLQQAAAELQGSST